ncbi:DUF5683 domain-containing protein [Mucilaginibacter sp. X4EP1]|uniref:DUF5683 domain-containing protein n=1 Tax=Mucilaginibacter sp. X4EP1 TaxID=2723092 RepID=UPI00216A9095|nr:DUF5683 domain-containing protein [Mucilaginibacter sp. X4EP1]MCS3815157.1 hypothetical protein [Mucilaginibacter sp. X4EP1]
MNKRSFVFPILLILTLKAEAQHKIRPDTAQDITDTAGFLHRLPKPAKERTYHPDTTHSPMAAIIKSAVLPGWGQLYNNRWWKVPLIYGGLTTFTVIIIYNNRNYQRDLRLYHYYNEIPKITVKTPDYVFFEKLLKNNIPQSEVADAVDTYQRDFQLGILGLAGFWGLQIVDAYIDAKFAHSFSMDDNLSIKIALSLTTQPVYAANFGATFIPVVKITLVF